jgi:outer membrane protein assembly factor BamB
MSDDRFHTELWRYWDAIARGEPASPGDLDPELVATIRGLHVLPDVPPDPAYAKQLRETLMHTATAPIPVTLALPSNGLAGPAARPQRSPGVPPRWRLNRASAQTALVLLLIAGLLTAFVAVFLVPREQRPGFVPAVATPTTDETPITGWPMYRGNAARTGAMPGPGLNGPPAILWQFAAGATATFPPAIADGVIYLPTDSGAFYALDAASGAVRWQTDGAFAMPSARDGVLYYVSIEESLVAHDLATDEELWRAGPGSRFWSPLVAGGVVYYGGEANLLTARDARTGADVWRSAPTALAARSAALADGMLVVGGDDHQVYGVDQATGEARWQYALGDSDATIQTPAIADGAAFVGTFGGDQNAFVALDLQTGAERWRLEGTESESFQAAGVADGVVYVPSDAGTLRALDATSGEVRWTYTSTEAIDSAPAIVDGVVYAGSSEGGNGIVLAVDAATGAEHWRLPLDGQADFGPAVVDGRLYIGTGTGMFYAIGNVAEVDAGATPVVQTPSGVMPATPAAGTAGPAGAVREATITPVWVRSKQQGDIAGGIPGLAIDPFSRLWLCNGADGSIEIFDRDGNRLSHIVGGLGSEPGQWDLHVDTPNGGMWDGCAIAFAPDGTAYITDVGNARVQVFDPTGALIGGWSTRDEGDSRLWGPIGITRLASGDFLVIDVGQVAIMRRFSADGVFQEYYMPGAGVDLATFDPISVLEDADGNLWITEWLQQRVIKLAPDGSLLLAIGGPSSGTEPGQFAEPTDLALDEQGNIYVADDDNRRLQVFAADGTFLAQFTGEEAGITPFGDQGGGVAVIEYGGNGYLYVVDYSRDDFANGEERLMKFRVTLPSPAATPTP